jgi:hypothetical protein
MLYRRERNRSAGGGKPAHDQMRSAGTPPKPRRLHDWSNRSDHCGRMNRSHELSSLAKRRAVSGRPTLRSRSWSAARTNNAKRPSHNERQCARHKPCLEGKCSASQSRSPSKASPMQDQQNADRVARISIERLVGATQAISRVRLLPKPQAQARSNRGRRGHAQLP